MAHNLEFDAFGRAMMAYAGEVPWHGLGKQVRPDLTPDQFLVEAGLNWEVIKCRQQYRYNDVWHDSDDVALIRTSDGKKLSTVSGEWEICQNSEAFKFFHEFVMAGDMEMHTAGSLHNGRMVWVLAKIKESFEIFDKDLIQPYLLFTNPHEYGRVIDIRLTPIRAVCDNTVTLALGGKGDLGVKLHHRKRFNADFVKDTMGITRRRLNDFKTMAEFLGSRRYSAENVVEYFKKVFPATKPEETKVLSRPAQIAMGALEGQPGAEMAEGSWWQPFNAVTFTTDHLLNRSNPTKRLTSSWYGRNRVRKQHALDLAVEMAEKSPPMAIAA